MQYFLFKSRVSPHNHRYTPSFALRGVQGGVSSYMLLMFSLLFVLGLLALPVTSAIAKAPQTHKGSSPPPLKKPQPMVYQGLILQKDATNSNDVMFSVLDRHSVSMTFHLTASTRFAPHQSASQLAVNMFVMVKANVSATGGQNATWVQFQNRNHAFFNVQGVVTSSDQNQNSLTLALNDGTLLTITIAQESVTQVQPGATVSLQAHFDASGSLIAPTYRIQASHASRFQARGIISHINPRSQRLTLLAPSGASLSIVENQAAHRKSGLHVGEEVTIAGNTDGKGDLDEQSTSVENTHEQYMTLEGVVSAIDTTANTFSLIDEDGNVSTINATPSLLASIQIGGVYRVEVSVAADGSFTADKVEVAKGSDQGQMLSLEGVVQSYDANSGVLSLAGDNGETFTLTINGQTRIRADDGASPTLADGQEIHAKVQPTADGSYTALAIYIQDNASSGDEMTFGGSLQTYDASTGQLTISTSKSQTQTLSFTVNTQTEVEGAASLNTIPAGTFLKIETTVQQDGSYLATRIEVVNERGDD